jgi:hypothetical protein
MLEEFLINWVKSKSRWFHYTDLLQMSHANLWSFVAVHSCELVLPNTAKQLTPKPTIWHFTESVHQPPTLTTYFPNIHLTNYLNSVSWTNTQHHEQTLNTTNTKPCHSIRSHPQQLFAYKPLLWYPYVSYPLFQTDISQEIPHLNPANYSSRSRCRHNSSNVSATGCPFSHSQWHSGRSAQAEVKGNQFK